MNVELVMTAQKLVMTAWWVTGSITKPTGCCIHEFAATMNAAEMIVPMLASQIDARWTRGLTRPRPKIQMPRNVDSMKKASRASMASGAPKMLPTKTEYRDQSMPNWNSWTMPVTTPMAKLTRKSLPKNLSRAPTTRRACGTRPSAGSPRAGPGRSSGARRGSGRRS